MRGKERQAAVHQRAAAATQMSLNMGGAANVRPLAALT